ncbi:hypothetical protein [Spiroplasma floricola]|uniref:Aldose 1-epimerase family protein n=1 Tax=Spiroplasma floricola 23-6 TaxID=1336749 RepID=A0A2K8SEU8_9MOLU|nr:hypothetical protein [Spiroplasma floricola]AUB31360.1 aldose 1-epimerase family protein [Spiroplasma floricola 23-6]
MNKIFNNSFEILYNINPFEIKSIKKSGVEILYQANGSWDKTWPILFPICGTINGILEHNGKQLGLKRHGFFNEIQNWKIIEESNKEVKIEYISNNDFYDIYPFKFSIIIEMNLKEEMFSLNIIVKNLENEKMYFSIGHHPGFIFNQNSNLKLLEEQLFTNKFKSGLVETLEKDILIKEINHTNIDFSNNISYMTDKFSGKDIQLNNKSIEFTLKVKNFKNLVLWKQNNESEFICVEYWNGIPDMLDKKSNEIKDKPEILSLESNESKDFLLEIHF